MRRIALFGGTFDPPHTGHLAIAESARDRLRLDRVVFMPTGTPPHKRGLPLSPAAARVAMTRLAVRGNSAFVVSTLEARRRGASYTIDTLRQLSASQPRTRIYLLLGEDGLADFRSWREPGAILELATLVVAPRPGSGPRSGERRAGGGGTSARKRGGPGSDRPGAVVWLDGPALDVSSTRIRALARAGRSVRYLVPEPVATYISRHRLYGSRR